MRFPSGGTASRHVVIHMTADTHMALTAGARVGPHEILSLEGIGGMGEVYKARDRRLARIVAIKFLRAEAAGQQHVIIAVTALSDRSDRERSIASGFNDVLVKPMHPRALIKVVQHHLARRARTEILR